MLWIRSIGIRLQLCNPEHQEREKERERKKEKKITEESESQFNQD